MIFPNGRLARLEGDSRVRYSYCQEYLLPSLLYAADHLGEEHAEQLVEAKLQLIEQEAEYSGDGSFYGRRLDYLKSNPYYYTRLESDRACCLAMLLAYAPLVQLQSAPQVDFEASVAGGWSEPEYGAVLHRYATRLASFSWRSYGMTQGLCLPPDAGHLPEWQNNLCSVARFLGDDGVINGGQTKQRTVLSHHIETFEGGFVTCGEVAEGMDLVIPEGCRQSDVARHYAAFAALPDGHTVIGLELIRAADKRSYLMELKGLHFAFANDFYNDFRRRITSEQGEAPLRSPAPHEEIVPLGSRWANVDGRVGVLGIYGADELVLHRSPQRRGGKYHSLFTEEICFPCEVETRSVRPGEVLLDIGWCVVSAAGPETTARLQAQKLETDSERVRAVSVQGLDGQPYLFIANFGETAFDASPLIRSRAARLFGSEEAKRETLIEPHQARLLGFYA